jgi:hypothetical protein
MEVRAVRASEPLVIELIERAARQPFADATRLRSQGVSRTPAGARAGLLWVTADENDEPVAYPMASVVDNCPRPPVSPWAASGSATR